MTTESILAGFCPSCRELILCPTADDWPSVGQAWTLTRHRGHATQRLTLTAGEVATYRERGARVLTGDVHGV